MSSKWVLVCQGFATTGVVTPHDLIGQYLKSFDVEAHEGRGTCEWTDYVGEAMKFEDFSEAVMAWQTQSKVRPLREDGRPNRPLTAFNVEPRLL